LSRSFSTTPLLENNTERWGSVVEHVRCNMHRPRWGLGAPYKYEMCPV